VSSGTHLGTNFEDALRYAVIAHGDQTRKSTKIPYIAHLLAVSALVLEAGGSEVQAIAALLHDAAEDCGGQPRLDDIRHRFGPKVAAIVKACSDSLVENPSEKAPWKKRKAQYLKHLRTVDEDVLLVSVADKLHNVRAILEDLRGPKGASVWDRFNAGKVDQLWYQGKLANVFRDRKSPYADVFERTVEELRTVANGGGTGK
jgi:Guanosine polyphosphate pyrophosphohydrolases/synthetases